MKSEATVRWLLRGVIVLLVVAVGSCIAVGADRPPDPRLLGSPILPGHSSRRSRVDGFGQIGFAIVSAKSAAEVHRCALLADSGAQRAKGMMGRHNLAGYDAMIFRWGADSTESFYNEGVPIPLSVAWFDSAGVFVGSATLELCTHPCPTVTPALAYRYALEVAKGGLGHLGVGQGSVLVVGGSC